MYYNYLHLFMIMICAGSGSDIHYCTTVYREKHIFDRPLVILNLHMFNLNEHTPERENMTPNEK
jgi:hypothetical protein